MAGMWNRIGEFTLLQHETHVYFKDKRWHLKSAVPDTSSKRLPRSRLVPQRLTLRIDRYNKVHRDALCRDLKTGIVRYTSHALWVSTRCRPRSESSIRENICKFTKSKFEKPVNPHAFRYSGITTIAVHAPEQMHAAQVVAGHRLVSTTTQENYNKACSSSASQEWNSIAAAIRERGMERRRLRRRAMSAVLASGPTKPGRQSCLMVLPFFKRRLSNWANSDTGTRRHPPKARLRAIASRCRSRQVANSLQLMICRWQSRSRSVSLNLSNRIWVTRLMSCLRTHLSQSIETQPRAARDAA